MRELKTTHEAMETDRKKLRLGFRGGEREYTANVCYMKPQVGRTVS